MTTYLKGKPSKRNIMRAALKAERRASGKPPVSKYAAKVAKAYQLEGRPHAS